MLIAGDVGGTKTLLGLFDPGPARPRPIAVQSFETASYDDLTSIVAEFLAAPAIANQPIESAAFGVAGPVIGDTADLTNIPWRIDARKVAKRFRLARVGLLNDLEAMAYGVTVLDESEVHVLQPGKGGTGGNIGIVAAGTGLGEATLHDVGGRLIPAASEGGHADFAARTEREIRLVRWLIADHGRAEVEDVVSGRGLLNIHRLAHTEACLAGVDLASPDAPATITRAGLGGTCPGCVEALDMFVDAYGAEAGNLALRFVTTGGMFVGGGIAPKILPALTDGRFIRAFLAKSPFEDLLASIPVKVILNQETGLIGAAVRASHLRASTPA